MNTQFGGDFESGAAQQMINHYAATATTPRNVEVSAMVDTISRATDDAGGRFPVELYRMLDTVTKRGMESLVSWQDDGKSFMIHNKPEFERVVMPM